MRSWWARPRSRTCAPIRYCPPSSVDPTGPVLRSGAHTPPIKPHSRRRPASGSTTAEAKVRSRLAVMPAFAADVLLAEAAEQLPEAVDLRRRIHRHPELGLELPRTQAAVVDALNGLDLDVRTGDGGSSVVADLRGNGIGDDAAVILLRADMDALPMPEDTTLEYKSDVDGAMHACGHDAHVAMLVGAARMLVARRAELPGTVRFMFQPGEEGFHGARFMLDEGLLDAPNVDAAFALHVSPNLPS